MIRVAAFTAGKYLPAARFRVRQYVKSLQVHGIDLREFPATLGTYPPVNKLLRPLWAVGLLASRLPTIARSYGYDVTLLQREMLSTFATLEPLTRKPRILDVDDAIWLRRNGSFARRLARICDWVVCGNSFLAENFRQWNSNVSILPTAVDSDRFRPAEARRPNSRPTVGWMGGQDGFWDLKVAEKALQVLLKKIPEAQLRVISDGYPHCLDLPSSQLEFIRWSPEDEVRGVQEIDIGIMPLRETVWNRGKCAYKMLLYMSCGVPVVVSPVGMTAEVARAAPVGRIADTIDAWVGAFEELLTNQVLAANMGRTARGLIVDKFSISALAPKLAAQILLVANGKATPNSQGCPESRTA